MRAALADQDIGCRALGNFQTNQQSVFGEELRDAFLGFASLRWRVDIGGENVSVGVRLGGNVILREDEYLECVTSLLLCM